MKRLEMNYLDLTLATPEQNLALDEALLDLAEEGRGEELIRFWEPRSYFAVLGYSGKVNREVYLNECQKRDIPILRRSSGGGTVLQGPGCLNYSLILKTSRSPLLQNLNDTNCLILKTHKDAIKSILTTGLIEVQGISDLTFNGLKFSGNAQRRKKDHLLFHGTFLTHFDFSFIEACLPIPDRKPDYRKNKTHREFLTNLNIPSELIKDALKEAWNATQVFTRVPTEMVNQLVWERYKKDEWNFKF